MHGCSLPALLANDFVDVDFRKTIEGHGRKQKSKTKSKHTKLYSPKMVIQIQQKIINIYI